MFVSRRRHNAEVAAARAESARLLQERDAARVERVAFRAAATTSAEKFAEADAANTRLAGRNARLADLLAIARTAQDDQAIEELHDRLDRALKNVVRWRAEAADLHAVNRFLGEQLMSAVGADYTPTQRLAVGLPLNAATEEEVKAS